MGTLFEMSVISPPCYLMYFERQKVHKIVSVIILISVFVKAHLTPKRVATDPHNAANLWYITRSSLSARPIGPCDSWDKVSEYFYMCYRCMF